MSTSKFENIRPYKDEEVSEIAVKLADSLDWATVLAPLIGRSNSEEIADAMPHIESVSDFQDDLTFPFLEALIESTTDNVSVSWDGENLDDVIDGAMLHLTNHKDIVLDPSLVNVARMGNGYPSTEIGIGDNLLSRDWVSDLVRLNRCFIVPRGGSVRDKWNSSLLVASYIRQVISEGGSVWLAQKEGRAKDGKDSTSPALMRMLVSEWGKESWDMLNVRPVCVSYEWDPCDGMKVKELLETEKNGSYEKRDGEDEMSMFLGLTGDKGRVHLHFCGRVEWEEREGERQEKVLAELVDDAIFRSYEIYPNQILSAKYLGHEVSNDFDEADVKKFNDRLASVVEYVGGDYSEDEIKRKWCEITAEPLLAKRAQSSK